MFSVQYRITSNNPWRTYISSTVFAKRAERWVAVPAMYATVRGTELREFAQEIMPRTFALQQPACD